MLTIQQFQSNYYLPAGAPDRAAIQNRMDRLVREHLPAVMADKLIPPPSDENAVYRIRNLRVDLWVDALGMNDGEIAQRWGTALVAATTRALVRGSPAQVVRFDDHAHFVAAFLGDLMAGQAWSRWVYDEFAPLRGLPVGQIAAHLLAPRPALLIDVAQRLAREGRLEALLQQLDTADVRLIWEQGLGFGTLPDAPVRGSVLDRILEALAGGVALEHGEGALARNTLRLYLQASSRSRVWRKMLRRARCVVIWRWCIRCGERVRCRGCGRRWRERRLRPRHRWLLSSIACHRR